MSVLNRLIKNNNLEILGLKRTYGRVVEYDEATCHAVVELMEYSNSHKRFINKSGEILKENDYVWIYYFSGLSSGYIGLRNGIPVPMGVTGLTVKQFDLNLFEDYDGSRYTYGMFVIQAYDYLKPLTVSRIIISDITNGSKNEIYNLQTDPNFQSISTARNPALTPIFYYNPNGSVSLSTSGSNAITLSEVQKDYYSRYIGIDQSLFEPGKKYRIELTASAGYYLTCNNSAYSYYPPVLASCSYSNGGSCSYTTPSLWESTTLICGDTKSNSFKEQIVISSRKYPTPQVDSPFMALSNGARFTMHGNTEDSNYPSFDMRNKAQVVIDDGTAYMDKGASIAMHGEAFITMSGGSEAKGGTEGGRTTVTLLDRASLTMENTSSINTSGNGNITASNNGVFAIRGHSNFDMHGDSQFSLEDKSEIILYGNSHIQLFDSADLYMNHNQIVLKGVQTQNGGYFYPRLEDYMRIVQFYNGSSGDNELTNQTITENADTHDITITGSKADGTQHTIIVEYKNGKYTSLSSDLSINNTGDIIRQLNQYLSDKAYCEGYTTITPEHPTFAPVLFVEGKTSLFFGGGGVPTWVTLRGVVEILNGSSVKMTSGSIDVHDKSKVCIRGVFNNKKDVSLNKKAEELYLESIAPETTPEWADLTEEEQLPWLKLADDRPAVSNGGSVLEISDLAEVHCTDNAKLNLSGKATLVGDSDKLTYNNKTIACEYVTKDEDPKTITIETLYNQLQEALDRITALEAK